MGQYDTTQLPIYKWLHEKNHPDYVIEDNFFQAAFGGSFLNHQYLIAAQAPTDANAPATQHSLVDTAGFPRNTYPLYIPIPGADLPRRRLHRPVPVAEGRPRLRQLRGQHDAAVVRALGHVRRQARAADERRRSATG